MIDFGVLPPEVNSGRMYSGPGSGPMVAVASAWQATAGQLDSVARGYGAVIAEVQDEVWRGNASTAMAEAAQPYVDWLANAAALAEETACQARAAAAAYEAAYSATVPPAMVTSNRARYWALVAANAFGQYTAQIAAAEAEYGEMWAQDAAAMYNYAASSSAATAVTPFGEPPQTTTAGAAPAQAAVVAQAVGNSSSSTAQSTLSQLLAAVPQQLQGLATAGSSASSSAAIPNPFLAANNVLLAAIIAFDQVTRPAIYGLAIARTFFSGGSYQLAANRTQTQDKDLPKISDEDAGGGIAKTQSAVPQGVRGPVIAEVGRAAPIGGLSAPQTWASSTPVASFVEEPQWLSDNDLEAVPSSADTVTGAAGAGPMVGMSPAAAPYSRASVNNVLRVAPRRFTMPRPALGG